jgi:hypothetical protein
VSGDIKPTPTALTGSESLSEPEQPVADKPEAPTRDEEPQGIRTNKPAQPVANETAEEPPVTTEERTTARPPQLGDVKITAGPEPEADTTREAHDATATPNVPAKVVERIDTFRQMLEEQETKVARDPNNLAEQYRLRMLYLVDNEDTKALSLSDEMDPDRQEIVQAQVRALMAAEAGAADRDLASEANRLLEPIENLRSVVRARADLRVPRVELCSSVEAFGLYEPIEPAEFTVGRKNSVVIYVEVDNFRSEKIASGQFRTLLSVRLTLLNKAGEEIWSMPHPNIEDLARHRRRDFFLTAPTPIPAAIPPGEYVLKVEVEDVLAGKINSNTARFKMVLP